MITVLIIGLFSLVMGYLIKYIIGRKKFERRAVTGIEVFSNYNRALATKLLEKILLFIAKLLIIVGLFLIGLWLADNYEFI